ncbi:hypothetical protein Tco_0043664, partial [Tanacetum coccineum]
NVESFCDKAMEIKDQRGDQTDVNYLLKRFAEEKSIVENKNKGLFHKSVKRACDIMEQVCDELEGDIEKQRETLQLADKLREERVEMKLAEAKNHLKKKPLLRTN